jgi:hypothetical protein
VERPRTSRLLSAAIVGGRFKLNRLAPETVAWASAYKWGATPFADDFGACSVTLEHAPHLVDLLALRLLNLVAQNDDFSAQRGQRFAGNHRSCPVNFDWIGLPQTIGRSSGLDGMPGGFSGSGMMGPSGGGGMGGISGGIGDRPGFVGGIWLMRRHLHSHRGPPGP